MLSPRLLLARNVAFGSGTKVRDTWLSLLLVWNYPPAEGRIGLSVHMGYFVPWIKCFYRSTKSGQDGRGPAVISWPR